MPTCAVAECDRGGKNKAPGISLHRFPIRNLSLCKVWVTKCHRDKVNVKTAKICSHHFTEDDYERDLMNELLNQPQRRILKPGAFPSIFDKRLGQSPVIQKTARYERMQKKKKLEIVTHCTATADTPENEGSKVPEEALDELTKENEEQSSSMALELSTLRMENQHLKSLISTIRRNHIQHVSRLERRISKLKQNLITSNTRMKSMLSTEQQKKLLGKKPTWSKEDIVKAMSLRSLSLKAYETVRTLWSYPLPCISTLRTWAKNFTCSPGVLSEVIDVLKEQMLGRDDLYRLAVLSFDEMSLDSRYSLDPTFDMVESRSKAQVALLRGLCQPWKQPIYYDFDTNMTKEVIYRVISSLSEANYITIAIVSDLGGDNQGLWRELEITEDNVYFQNPLKPSEKIFVFADIPHQMKNIRNHLIDDGALLPNGNQPPTLFAKEHLEHMIACNGVELQLCPKLTHYLLEVKGAERMRVAPAVQLLSHHSSVLSRRVFPANPEVPEFFQIFDDGFDIFNSRTTNPSKPMLSPFGKDLEKQTEVLLKWKLYVSKLRFLTKKKKNPKKSLLPCQTGIIVSINSLLQLYYYAKLNHGVDYILTSRLNSDALESFFSLVRSFSNNPNPVPAEFRYRLRLIILGCKIRIPRNSNVKIDREDLVYLSSQLISRNKLYPDNVIPSNEDTTGPLQIELPETLTETETNSCRYLAGYIAWKLKRNGKRIYGVPTSMNKTPAIGNNLDGDWIEGMSRGGLLVPNEVISHWVMTCEQEFRSFESHFQNRRGVSSVLTRRICKKYPDMDLDVVKAFLKTRIRIKIKNLNKARYNGLMKRKKARQFLRSNPSKQTQQKPSNAI